MLRRHSIFGGLVVDLGCGSGIWARELTRAGYDVLGVDISPSMIRLARQRAPKARLVVGSFFAAEMPACAAVTSLGECLNYCFDPGSGRKALGKLFRRVYEAEEDRRRNMLTRRITTFRKVGRLYRRREEVHRLRLFERDEIARERSRIGFQARTLRRWGSFRLPDGHAVVFARKP